MYRDESRQIGTCRICKEPILEYEEIYDMDGWWYHKECFEDHAVDILVKECGAVEEIAKFGMENDW